MGHKSKNQKIGPVNTIRNFSAKTKFHRVKLRIMKILYQNQHLDMAPVLGMVKQKLLKLLNPDF